VSDTLDCPICGPSTPETRETNDGSEMVCSSCGWRFYPPEDRGEYLIRRRYGRKPASFKIAW
jgi:hypothetical protein